MKTRHLITAAVTAALALLTITTPAAARIPDETPASRSGRIFLTLIIATPGSVPIQPAEDSPVNPIIPQDTPITTDITDDTCHPGQWSDNGPHPCPQVNRTHSGQDNNSPIPAPMPAPMQPGKNQ